MIDVIKIVCFVINVLAGIFCISEFFQPVLRLAPLTEVEIIRTAAVTLVFLIANAISIIAPWEEP